MKTQGIFKICTRINDSRELYDQGTACDSRVSWFVQYSLVILFQTVLSILAAIVVAWFSRQRKFRADAGAA